MRVPEPKTALKRSITITFNAGGWPFAFSKRFFLIASRSFSVTEIEAKIKDFAGVVGTSSEI